MFAAAYAKLALPRLLELTVGVFGVFQGAIAIVVFVGLVERPPPPGALRSETLLNP